MENCATNSIFISLIEKNDLYISTPNGNQIFGIYSVTVIILSVENPDNITIILIIQMQNPIFISLIESRSKHLCMRAAKSELLGAEKDSFVFK